MQDNGKYTDYTLNTTTGNRPARVAPSGCKAGQPCYYVPPQYIFNGDTPKAGENYRVALARNITGDFQFARATVNYMWAQFFGRGIVDPPDTFDPARLDPDNPPPCSVDPAAVQRGAAERAGAALRGIRLQPQGAHARDRELRYLPAFQPLQRPVERRVGALLRAQIRAPAWSEEVHDAVAQSSGTMPSYSMAGFTDLGYAKVSYAMQLPDVIGAPSGDGNASGLLDSFLRGNRDDQPRKPDGSILQALNLMNNNFVVQRIARRRHQRQPVDRAEPQPEQYRPHQYAVPDDSFALPLERRDGHRAGGHSERRQYPDGGRTEPGLVAL